MTISPTKQRILNNNDDDLASEDTNNKTITIQVVGMTQRARIGEFRDVNRQEFYQRAWRITINKKRETLRFPLGFGSHAITLIHDKYNKFDKNAIRLIFNVNDTLPYLTKFNGMDIGFIPMRWSSVIVPSLHRFTQVQFIRLHNHDNTYVSGQVLMQYDDSHVLDTTDRTITSRFKRFL